jgi:hypothetical protein
MGTRCPFGRLQSRLDVVAKKNCVLLRESERGTLKYPLCISSVCWLVIIFEEVSLDINVGVCQNARVGCGEVCHARFDSLLCIKMSYWVVWKLTVLRKHFMYLGFNKRREFLEYQLISKGPEVNCIVYIYLYPPVVYSSPRVYLRLVELCYCKSLLFFLMFRVCF